MVDLELLDSQTGTLRLIKYLYSNNGAGRAEILRNAGVNQAPAYRAISKLRDSGMLIEKKNGIKIEHWLTGEGEQLGELVLKIEKIKSTTVQKV